MHQDAHEFLNYLLNSIVEDLTLEMKAGPIDDCQSAVFHRYASLTVIQCPNLLLPPLPHQLAPLT